MTITLTSKQARIIRTALENESDRYYERKQRLCCPTPNTDEKIEVLESLVSELDKLIYEEERREKGK